MKDRAAFLDGACHGDPKLRQRLEALLAAHDQPATELDSANTRRDEFHESPTEGQGLAELDPPIELDEAIGQTLGRYKLREKIGEGGCGVVYVAEQTEPVRRRVALKVIKLGMDTKQVVARFEAERQALAMMDHPNIAKVLDAGMVGENSGARNQDSKAKGARTGLLTPDSQLRTPGHGHGRPYFVMELVRGIRITDYCDQNKLSTRERLELFIKTCQAIQHAHQKGIIHRDIKPSNILVTLHDGVPLPKVIDFGIAKATEGKLTDATVYTHLYQFIGTPAYMSPEQAEMSGLDIDTRSDIYSLGVLLYELLTGRTPFDGKELMSMGIDAMRKTIREQEPLRPSTKLNTLPGDDLTTTARRHGVDVPKLVSQLRGDLDWIVMKCLEKDRTRRYETANGLAMELRRYLNNEPVVARPPSSAYRFQKLVRRNKLAFAAAGAVAAALLLGIIVSTWQAVVATHAKQEALAAQTREALQREKAEANERKAVTAQASEAKQKAAAQRALYDSLLGQARATRLARRLGYRQHVFDLLEQAKALDVPQKNPADLRNEAVACLGDFVGLLPATFTNFPTHLGGTACLAPSGKLAAFGLSDGTIQLLETPSGKAVARLAGYGTNGSVQKLCFNATGDQLFAKCWSTAENAAQFIQSLSSHRLLSYACNADGRWQEVGNRPLPGAGDLFNKETEVFAVVVDVGSFKSGDTESRSAKFKLFNVTTGAFVAGYNVTNALPTRSTFWCDHTPDGRFLVVETEDKRNPKANAVLNLFDWTTGRRINRLHLAMSAVSLSPDGKHLASLTEGGGAIYLLPSFERIGQFKEHFVDRSRAVFSRSMVALPLHQQQRVRLWNLETREDIALLDEPELAAPAAFSPKGHSLLTIGNYHARLYRLNTPEKLDLPAHAAAVTGLAFSPDGKSLASVGKGRVTRVCDAVTGRILWQTNDLPGGQCIGYSPDGQCLATGGASDQVWIRDAQTGQRVLGLGTNLWAISSTQFSPDDRFLATASGLGVIRIYRIEPGKTGDKNGRLRAKLVKSSPQLEPLWNLVFAPDGRSLSFTTIGPIGKLYLWNFNEQAQPRNTGISVPTGVEMESFTRDGHLLAMDRNGRIVTLEMPTGKELSAFQARKLHADTGVGICLSPDGSKLAVSSPSALGVDIWDPKTGKPLTAVAPLAATNVVDAKLSSDASRVALASVDGTVRIWDVSTGHLSCQFEEEGGPVRIFRFFSGDNRLLTWTETDEMLHVWNLATNPVAEVQFWRGPASLHFGDVALSPDNRFCMAVGGEVSTVERNLKSQESTFPQLRLLETCCCEFSPNGSFFAIASNLGYARVWNAATWQEVKTLRGFQDAARSVAFSPNGRRLATSDSGPNEALKLWDAASWQQVLSLKSVGFPTSTAFSPDGNTLASGSSDGLNIWHAPSWDEIHAAEPNDPPSDEYGATGKMEDEQP